MQEKAVVVVGGGATGAGIMRDLAMRGVKVVLLEQSDLAYGTSSRFHGLLHSGGRYAVKDAESAKECIEENYILRKIAPNCVEVTEGLFVRLPEDDETFEAKWVEACGKVGIPIEPVSKEEVLKLEPNVSKRMVSAYRIPDSAIDGFRLCWQNVISARKYGGEVLTYTKLIGIEQQNGQVTGVKVRNLKTGEEYNIACRFVVNAAGSWVGEVAELAGIKVNVKPDRGVLVAFNHRFANRVVNRLRPPSDGDIFVPHGSITILGTTSSAADRPDDIIPRSSEVLALINIGEKLFEDLRSYRILRAFAGTRPLYSADPNAAGRAASRNFTIIDHSKEGLEGFATIVGGKFTTYRLMAEKMTDLVCKKLGVNEPCRTAQEELVPSASPAAVAAVKRWFPGFGAELAAERLGERLDNVVKKISEQPEKKQLVCECELVTLAEIEEIAGDKTSHTLSDIRRRTRMGMGTCQGSFCGFRGIGAVVSGGTVPSQNAVELLSEFVETRWKGIRPALWGTQLKEVELMREIYCATLNIDGAIENEKI